MPTPAKAHLYTLLFPEKNTLTFSFFVSAFVPKFLAFDNCMIMSGDSALRYMANFTMHVLDMSLKSICLHSYKE